jgi:hypothetical protein
LNRNYTIDFTCRKGILSPLEEKKYVKPA